MHHMVGKRVWRPAGTAAAETDADDLMKGKHTGKARSSARSSGGSPGGRQTARSIELFILAPDDDISRALVTTLGSRYAVRIAANAAALRAGLASRGADLLLLDAATTGVDVIQLCYGIRLISAVAMIVLAATGNPEERIRALEHGADDCFSRRLGIREIKARIASLVRRASFGAGALSHQTSMRFAGWVIDPQRRILSDPAGDHVDLTAAEFDLLWAFCRNGGKTLTRQRLLTLTRVGAARPTERSIDVHVMRLRAKIEEDPHHPVMLKTVRLGGYMFTPLVEIDL